jgi:class 3 adenylate cyclase
MAFQQRFMDGLETGLANLAKESGVVRLTFAGADIDGSQVTGFAYQLASLTGVRVPQNNVRLAYRSNIADGQTAFKQYPVHTASMLPADWLRGKIVLIGADLPQQDRHQTPLSLRLGARERTLPGIVIHAHILAQLLEAAELPVLPAWAETLILIAAVVAGVALSMFALPLLATALIGVIALVGFWFLGFELFSAAGPMIELVGPSIGFLAAIGVAGGYGRRKERATKRLLRKAFSRYVSPKVIQDMLADPARLSLGGETRDMSFIFTDIAGFTSLSEKISPEQAIGLLQDYLNGMVEIALDHDGAIDKFIGDAVMVFFGAPIDQPDHPERAVRCAMAMDRFAETFRREQQANGIDFGHTRIGVHTGSAVVGNIGSRRRFEYTSVGDTVNSAARLEGVNKYFGTRLCISGKTVARCEGIELRPVGDVVLKGKQKALEVFTSWNVDTDAPMDDYRYAYNELTAGRDTARDLFERLAEKHPDDQLVRYHLARLEQNQTGVYLTMESK